MDKRGKNRAATIYLLLRLEPTPSTPNDNQCVVCCV